MSNKYRPRVLVAVALVMAACASKGAVVPSSTPPTTIAVPPTTQTTAASPATTTSVAESPIVIVPWSATRSHLTLILPDGWEVQDGFVRKGDPEDRPNFMRVGSSVVGNIFSDPCRDTLFDPPPGPTVDDLAFALTNVLGWDATAPTEVTLDGFVGKQMVLTVPGDTDFSECVTGRFMAWSEDGISGSRWLQGPGQIQETWIVDVEGERLLIDASYFPEISRGNRAELQKVIDSIQIETE
jgi:hypothetical protein